MTTIQIAHALPQSNPVPGGVLVLPLQNINIHQVNFQNHRVAIVEENKKRYALIGLPLDSKPGSYAVSLQLNDGSIQQHPFSIQVKKYAEQRLTVKDQRKVDPTAEDMIRIEAEQIRMDTARKTWSESEAHYDFIQPVDGVISSIFGLRRFFNGELRRPHSGLDLAITEGTPIKAVADGTVIESGDFFFSGNMVYLNHGQGVISLYAHLHEIQVKTGDQVKRGHVIGTVGQTGRVTGPHLHLGLILNQTLVDPVLFLPPQTGSH